jgi:alkanesulfonate monooxygenase SsuD/methylene tetrahydromethanopterin reductase-like flavin-dependent oxidoreductase (luciferase family)
MELGLGAAWHVGETRAYGIPLGTVKERLDRFAEALQVLKLLLTPSTDRRNFQGSYFTLDDAPFAPRPVQRRLPVLIGGGGEKRTLRLVAEYADTYNFSANFLATPEAFKRKNALLDEYCAVIGRNPGEIRRTVCVFADLVSDENKARAQREFMGRTLPPERQDALLMGSPQYVVDGMGRLLEQIQVDEVIFCALTADPEVFQRFDEEVLRVLQPAALVASPGGVSARL